MARSRNVAPRSSFSVSVRVLNFLLNPCDMGGSSGRLVSYRLPSGVLITNFVDCDAVVSVFGPAAVPGAVAVGAAGWMSAEMFGSAG